MTDNKNSVIRCRLEKELHENFMSLCKDKAINASELMRQWILAFVQNNTKDKKESATRSR